MAGQIPGRFDIDPNSLREALGVTQFSSTVPESWYHIFNGLVFQGGLSLGAGVIQLPAPYEQQNLGVWLNGGTTSGYTLFSFVSSGAGHWFSIGV